MIVLGVFMMSSPRCIERVVATAVAAVVAATRR
jgi:hypothetical protein